MHPRMFMFSAALLITANGCAGSRYTQELGRLKSDMGLMDQRVSQLERGSVEPPTGSLWPSDAAAPSPSASTTSSSVFPSANAVSKPAKKQIQQALKNAGFYKGSIHGKLGPKTRDAIREFQRANGLKADGVAGVNTWAKLSPYLDLTGTATASLTEPPPAPAK